MLAPLLTPTYRTHCGCLSRFAGCLTCCSHNNVACQQSYAACSSNLGPQFKLDTFCTTYSHNSVQIIMSKITPHAFFTTNASVECVESWSVHYMALTVWRESPAWSAACALTSHTCLVQQLMVCQLDEFLHTRDCPLNGLSTAGTSTCTSAWR